MVVGSSPGNPNGSFTVDVNSTSTVNWHAAVLPGANWLTISTTSVSSTSAAPGKVIYTINPAAASALAVGTYYGTIEVTSGGAVNSPQDYLVVLNVNAAPDLLQPDPEPARTAISSSNGTSAVPSQTVNLYSGSTSPLAFLASVSSSDKWLSVTASGSGTAGVGAPGSSIVSVNTAGMSSGVYTGTVSYQFIGSGSSAGVRSVNVTLIIQKVARCDSVRQKREHGPRCSQASAADVDVRAIATRPDANRARQRFLAAGILADSAEHPAYGRLRQSAAERPGDRHLLEWRCAA